MRIGAGLVLFEAGASSATDVTGFGLSGHALEMARGADLCLTIDSAALPQLPGAQTLCGAGFTCGGTKANARHTSGRLQFADHLGEDMIGLIHDPQTSGGLLVAVAPERCDELCEQALAHAALCAAVIGEVSTRAPDDPYVAFV